MRIVKTFLLIILLIVGVGAGLTVASHYFPNDKLKAVTNVTSQFQPLIASSLEKATHNDVTEKLGAFRSNVLGVQSTKEKEASTSSDSSDNSSQSQDASVTQKTFEFARYSYCQEVVKQYEAKKN